jgi:hypothetical protein
MGFLWFGRKKEDRHAKLKSEVRSSFSVVKQDVKKIGHWIKHLNERDDEIERKFKELRQDIDEIKSFVSFFDTKVASRVFKQKQTAVHKQTAVQAVQTPVQTVVQTAFLQGLTTNERMIIWTLLNTDMKLSYDDIAALLGKNKSTIRGQINNIKQKNENLICEFLEKNGKKRHYIDEKMGNLLIKKAKARSQRVGKIGRKTE